MSGRATVGYLDCSTGVSGDKLLGALLDAGSIRGDFTSDDLRALVATLAPEARVEVERVLSCGVSAVGVRVSAEGEAAHRHWSDIRALLTDVVGLPEPARLSALRTFETLAIAEAAVHGVSPDEVHFHEVGATDSIVDIVGACAGYHALGIDRMVLSSIAVGSGTVETSHGTLPVPAPATAALLVGLEIVAGPSAGELTTPTGAALAVSLGSGVGPMPAMRVDRIGYGAGTRDIGSPNVCRLMLGESSAATSEDDTLGLSSESVVLLESNIDHLSPEALAFAAEELLAQGALDAWQTPIVMKKGRSAVMLSALATPQEADALAERLVTLTGTLGVRRTNTERHAAPREIRDVPTRWGLVAVKFGAGRIRPEHDDIARIAREHELPYADVASEIAREAARENHPRGPRG